MLLLAFTTGFYYWLLLLAFTTGLLRLRIPIEEQPIKDGVLLAMLQIGSMLT
ncbi:hypothetical protein [Candidatus Tremblaya phenacola]|uniref:hypothetical protein n=1 Tax=Candidatus Tremblayella phenacoccinincola TaxID=1010676 RepID=UPI0013308006|nr:hypothetical protein [Candidatus Tremblaya phenacola]KAH0998348.1 hypothetical protein FKM95_000073 [Candidatus Tremblaya phenacola]